MSLLSREAGGGSVSAIRAVSARRILDSRGEPTIEVDVELQSGSRGRSSAPSGASKGEFEAVELRDGDAAFAGRGVRRAIENVEREIDSALVGLDAGEQETVDERLLQLDGTQNKSRLGANAIVATSVAVATGACQIKAGAPCRGERIAKYNRLLRIEEELGDAATYAGWSPFRRPGAVSDTFGGDRS